METKLWFGRKITYDPEKYTLKGNDLGVAIVEKNTEKKVFSTYNPIMIQQINDNEFLTACSKTKNAKNTQRIFKHIFYDEKKNQAKLIYAKEFETSRYVINYLKNIDDVYFIEGISKTTLYNAKLKKTITFYRCNISEEIYTDNEENKYIEITEKIISREYNTPIVDYLKIYLNLNTLEFDGFYSTLQDRYIPIIKESENNFKVNYASTVTKEVIHYIDLLTEIEMNYQEELNKRASNTIIKKKQLKKVES